MKHMKNYIVVSAWLCAATWLCSCQQPKTDDSITSVQQPATTSTNSFYVGNKAPLKPLHFIKLPMGSVEPTGWVLKYLQLQKNGLTGHLGEISAWLEKKDNAWLSKDGSGGHGWEEVPYWLKGYGDMAYLLKDSAMIRETKTWIDAVLQSQRPDGYFGPLTLKNGKPDVWPNMIMLKALTQYQEATADSRVIPLMQRYFAYQARNLAARPLENGRRSAGRTRCLACFGFITAQVILRCWI